MLKICIIFIIISRYFFLSPPERKLKVPTSFWLGPGLLWALSSLLWVGPAPGQGCHLREVPKGSQAMSGSPGGLHWMASLDLSLGSG